MRNKRLKTIGIELIKDTDLKESLCKRYDFKLDFLERMIVSRAIGDSWEKIISMFSFSNLDQIEKSQRKLYFSAIKNNDEFSSLVSDKINEFGLIIGGIEENYLIEKLKSVIKGDQQGLKSIKIQHKQFLGGGKMDVTEEIVQVPLYPSVNEQIKATSELHKLTFLDAKTKEKARVDSEKANREKTELFKEMEQVHLKSEEARIMEEQEGSEITMEVYDKLIEEVKISDEGVDLDALGDI